LHAPQFARHRHEIKDIMRSSRITIFVVLAFALSWGIEIPLIALNHREFIGAAVFGPAVAAMIVSYRGERISSVRLVWRLIAFGISLAICWALVFFRAPPQVHQAVKCLPVLAIGVALMPAWVVSAAFSRDRGVRSLMRTLVVPRSWPWCLIGALSFAIFLAAPVPFAHLWGGTTYTQPGVARGLPALLLFLSTFFLGGGVTEEPGWRGFLLPHLQLRMSPLFASLIVWIFWALWHLPLDLDGDIGSSYTAYFANRFLLLLPLTVIMTWLYNRSRGSLLAPALFHTAFNTFPSFVPSAGGTSWLLWVWAGVVLLADRMWRRAPTTSPSEAVDGNTLSRSDGGSG
jgi:membrane protease YdiL (CAAX protease family)